MSEESPQSWTVDASETIVDQGVAGTWVLALIGGLLVGIVAAVVGGAVWVGAVVLTERMYAALAIIVGFIVGLGVYLGAGRRTNLGLAAIAVVLTLITLALSEYFIVRHFAIQRLIEQGSTVTAPLFLPLQDMLDIVVGSISDEPINLMFWIAACVGAFIIPSRGPQGNKH